MLACHAGGRGFESRHPRHFNTKMSYLIKVLKVFKRTLAVLIGVWLLGLFIFLLMIPKPATEAVGDAQAVVVLTGGSNRLETGLKVFIESQAHKILISGVGYKVTKKDILRNFLKPENRQKINVNDVIIGSIADSTVSNAVEAKIFMDLHKFKSLRLVTSNYHMPRSMLIFSIYMPEYEIIPHPVGAENISLFDGKAKLIIVEYSKLLGFVFLTAWDWYSYYFDAITSYILRFVYRSTH